MRRGNLRVSKDHRIGLWRIQGRKNGKWVDATDADRKEVGLSEDLVFELKYDACGYLEGFIDWVVETERQKRIAHIESINPIRTKDSNIINVEYKKQKKAKRKIVKDSRKRNRRN